MKRLIVLLILFVLGCSNSSVSNKELIEVFVSDLNLAMVDRNKEGLELMTMEELSYGHSSGKIENKENFINEIVNGRFDFLSINTENQTILFSGENIAIVRNNLVIEATDNDKRVSVQVGNIMILTRQQRQWKLLARQAFKI